jgi:anti-sigma factor RsiW
MTDRDDGTGLDESGGPEGCADLAPELYAHLRGELDDAASQRVLDHLAGCPGCAATLQEMERLEQLLTSPGLTPREPTPELRRRLRAALREPARPEAAEKPLAARPEVHREGWPEVPPPRRLPPR